MTTQCNSTPASRNNVQCLSNLSPASQSIKLQAPQRHTGNLINSETFPLVQSNRVESEMEGDYRTRGFSVDLVAKMSKKRAEA